MRQRLLLLLVVFLLVVSPSMAQDSSIAEIVAERPELSQFYEILELAEPSILEELADADSEFTLFAPSNAALEQFAADMEEPDSWQAWVVGADSFETMLENEEVLTEIARYHLIDELILWDDLLLALGTLGRTYQVTSNGDFLRITATLDNRREVLMEQGIHVSSEASIDLNVLGIEASNGVIYLIDYLLTPEIRLMGDILIEDASYGEFNALLELIEAADPSIMEMLNDPEANVTLFAPYNEAFAALDNWDELISDSEAATAFISAYIIPETVYAFQLDAESEIEALGGELLSFAPPEEAYLDGFLVNGAYVSFSNRTAKNGVIHELESLMD